MIIVESLVVFEGGGKFGGGASVEVFDHPVALGSAGLGIRRCSAPNASQPRSYGWRRGGFAFVLGGQDVSAAGGDEVVQRHKHRAPQFDHQYRFETHSVCPILEADGSGTIILVYIYRDVTLTQVN